MVDTIIYKTNTRLDPDSVIKITSYGKVKKFKITNEQYIDGGSGGYLSFGHGGGEFIGTSYSIHYTYELKETIKSKSVDEIAAEESVAKAKEALKAAENALKVVKEQKK